MFANLNTKKPIEPETTVDSSLGKLICQRVPKFELVVFQDLNALKQKTSSTRYCTMAPTVILIRHAQALHSMFFTFTHLKNLLTWLDVAHTSPNSPE